MVTCSIFESEEFKNEGQKFTNVEYSADGSSITIYFDGSAPVPANRALSRELARMGHDFFEVTFCYNDGGTYRIARASWELGEPAGISDVYRTVGGVDYYIPARPVGELSTGLPQNNEGLVVLFVGRKSDKSLLAVGTLSDIDNGSGNVSVTAASNPLISTSTKKVSFFVNALKAGVSRAYNTDDNSFKITSSSPAATPAQPNGSLGEIKFGDKRIPFYHLPLSATAAATYTIGVSATGTSYADYAPAIRYSGGTSGSPGALCYKLNPHHTLPLSPNLAVESDKYQYNSGVQFSITSPTPVTTGGASFDGTVNFSITTTSAGPFIAALSFRIAVYAVYKRPSPVQGETEPVQWYIKPGYNLYYEELDGGDSENGGAVLIGWGEFDNLSNRELILEGEPRKYNDVPGEGGRLFTLQGINIYYRDGNLTNLTPNNVDPYDWWADTAAASGSLVFYYDNGTPPNLNANLANPSAPTSTLDDIAETQMTVGAAPLLPYGFVKILAVYTPNPSNQQETYSLAFYVEVNRISQAISIPYQNRFFITKPEDYLDIANYLTSGDYLFVFAESVNLPDMTMTLTGNVTIYMVANVEGVIIGRKGGTERTTFNGNYSVTINMGKWPFNSPAFAGGNVVTPELFNVSSANTYGNYGSNQIATTNTMFRQNTGTGSVTINKLAGIEVSYPQYVPVAP